MLFYLQNSIPPEELIMDFKLILGVMMLLALPFSAESGKGFFLFYQFKSFRTFTNQFVFSI